MSVQFFHQNNEWARKRTFAVEVPTKRDLLDFVSLELFFPGRSLPIRVGVAKCMDIDQYCKETGRQIAINRMETVDFEILDTSFDKNRLTVTLKGKDFLIIKLKIDHRFSDVHLKLAYD